MRSYKNIFINVLQEDMTAATAFGGGNNVGQTAGSFDNVDSYAPGDARIPKALGTVDLTDRKKKKKKKVKQKHKVPKGETVPVIQSRETGMTGTASKAGYGFM